MVPVVNDNASSPLHENKKGIFISASIYLSNAPGGAQRCTREYLSVIKAAGWDLEILPYSIDRHWKTRIRRKLKPSPFLDRIPRSFISEVEHRVQSEDIHWIFVNQVDSLPIVPNIKKAAPSVKIVLLSHGAQLIDDFLAAFRNSPSRRTRVRLADTILDEMHLRSYLDHVFTLSEQEVSFERWLGAKSVSWVPRLVSPHPLIWKPVAGRFGFVGTLDHEPNYKGLFSVLSRLQSIEKFNGQIRVVSGSKCIGEALAKRFPFVKYLGRLSPLALRSEAATWRCFLHPLFCWSRGCSTKLADALEWQIPVLTTNSGCRGYNWKDGNVLKASTEEDFCNHLIRINSEHNLDLSREDIRRVSVTSPSIEDVSFVVKNDLHI